MTSEGTIQANLVMESKGRHVYQRFISNSDAEELKNVDRDRLDERKTIVKHGIIDTDKTFYGIIYNDNLEISDTLKIRIHEITYSPDWTIFLKIDDISKIDGDTFTTSGPQRHIVELTFNRDTQDPAAKPIIPGEMASVILQVYPDGDETGSDNQDIFQMSIVLPLITYADINLDYEPLVEDEIIFPTTFDHTGQDVIASYISHRTTELLRFLIKRLNGVTIPDYETVRKYLINRVMWDCYKRFAEFAISGGSEFIPLLNLLNTEARQLKMEIQQDSDSEDIV